MYMWNFVDLMFPIWKLLILPENEKTHADENCLNFRPHLLFLYRILLTCAIASIWLALMTFEPIDRFLQKPCAITSFYKSPHHRYNFYNAIIIISVAVVLLVFDRREALHIYSVNSFSVITTGLFIFYTLIFFTWQNISTLVLSSHHGYLIWSAVLNVCSIYLCFIYLLLY